MVRLLSPNRPTTQGAFSRRDGWRLFSLVLAVVMVGLLIRQLQQPKIAERLDQVMAVSVEQKTPPVAVPHDEQQADPAQFKHLLALAGWDAARFAKFDTDAAITDDERTELLELLRRLQTFDCPQLAAWASRGKTASQVLATPVAHQGELVLLTGHVTAVERHAVPPELAERLEMPAYYECLMELDDQAGKATIFTARVPKAWTELATLNERAATAGVFVKSLPPTGKSAAGLFVSREIAWHPDKPNTRSVSVGESVLGGLGVDVGLLDTVRQRRAISRSEREAFYQMLDAVGRIGTNQLARLAGHNLESMAQTWAAEEQRLTDLLKGSPSDANPRDRQRLHLAHEVQARAAKGLFSVAPLFNDAENQVGELVALEGTARRVTRVDVGKSRDGTLSDVARRFGIDHYYEIDVFTDDSQNNPVVFCARELPPSFPLGDGLHEPVRIAGFFFKSWSFRSHRAEMAEARNESPQDADLRQFAPLVIGRAPIWIESTNPKAGAYTGYFATAAFVLLLGVVWAAGLWLDRGDRRFIESTLAKHFSPPEGESLNDFDLDHSPGPRENE